MLEGRSRITKAAPEHLLGQLVPGQHCAGTAGFRLQASTPRHGVTAWRARLCSRPSLRAPGSFQLWTSSLLPVQPFPKWPLDGAVTPPGTGGAFAGSCGLVVPVDSRSLALPAGGAQAWEHKAAAQSPVPPYLPPKGRSWGPWRFSLPWLGNLEEPCH